MDERCLENSYGGLTPSGPVCQEPTGLRQCRATCPSGDGCPASRPYCREISLSAGCCTDAGETVNLCCANPDARDVTDCR